MKDTIKHLQEKEKATREVLNRITEAINALQNVCDHKNPDGSGAFEYEGNDSHYDYVICSICGKTEKR